jgi:hypothetical protein
MPDSRRRAPEREDFSRTAGVRGEVMYARGLVVWCGLLVLAIVNGALREATLVPSIGDAPAHAVSSLTLSAAILALSWLTIGWIAPASSLDAWRIGGLWLALTLAFEFLAGHYLFGSSWDRLLADYNVLRGRIWIAVLVTTAVAPFIAARLQRPASVQGRPSPAALRR